MLIDAAGVIVDVIASGSDASESSSSMNGWALDAALFSSSWCVSDREGTTEDIDVRVVGGGE